ncbi:MAG: amino acid racemase [Eubacterium sp.]|nr:amino acid racemase [Eubacterium sp.]
MKKIGLVGGVGPASTIEYYSSLVKRCLADSKQTYYPEIVIDSVNMAAHDAAFEVGDYERLCNYLLESLNDLKAAGAKIAAITANTEHIVWDMICDRFPLPVVSIVDAAVARVKALGYGRALVFGTTFTMRSGLYEKALGKQGIVPIIPSESDIEIIGKCIYPNLENGIVIPEDRNTLIEIAEQYIKREKADVLMLACTELPLAISPGDVSIPTLNTTEIHIEEIYRQAAEEICT